MSLSRDEGTTLLGTQNGQRAQQASQERATKSGEGPTRGLASRATQHDAEAAFDPFLEKYQPKYAAACECLPKDRNELLTFYDFPTEHWGHLRTTHPIESTFATIRLRHRKTKDNGTRQASLAIRFKLGQSASKRWKRLRSYDKIPYVLQGRQFKDGIMQEAAS